MVFEVEYIKVFALVFVRFSGLITTAPILGSSNVPVIAKIGLTGLCAFLVTPNVHALPDTLPSEPIGFALMGFGELMIGLLMGFVMTLLFSAIQIGGQIADMQTGFGLINVFNPAFETQFPVFGFFLFILAVFYLLAIDGHLIMIRALASTFDKIPLGGFVFHPELMGKMSTWGGVMFYDGLIIAAPVAGAMLLAYMTMGLLSRVVPQIHLFVVGFPITIALGLLVVGLSAGVYLTVLDGMFYRMFKDIETLINGMS